MKIKNNGKVLFHCGQTLDTMVTNKLTLMLNNQLSIHTGHFWESDRPSCPAFSIGHSTVSLYLLHFELKMASLRLTLYTDTLPLQWTRLKHIIP